MAIVKVESLYGKLHLFDQIIPFGESGEFEESDLDTPEVAKLVEMEMIKIHHLSHHKKEDTKKEEPKKADPKKKDEEV